jgi:processive 1,2-diacylglycerol beta-glucosyltransferase
LKRTGEQRGEAEASGLVLILSISNGAGHMRAAEAIALALRDARHDAHVMVVDVAKYMTRLARFTHVTAYLWLVRYAPRVWEKMDRHQKRQPRTSPEWYYRRGCRRLFKLAEELRPSVLIATEVGCCEIAALIKRDILPARTLLVAVNGEYDADRAWVQPEVNLYCAATAQVREELLAHGADDERIRVWGVPLGSEFRSHFRRDEERAEMCRRLRLAPLLPLILVAGGMCGLGRIEEIVERLLGLRQPLVQVIVLTGKNERLRRRLNRRWRTGAGTRLRVVGWTPQVANLLRGADILVSKMGSAFDEAMAAELPLVGLEPPPGSERIQHKLLDEWGTGRAVRDLDGLVDTVSELLTQREQLEAMRRQARGHSNAGAAPRLAEWVWEQEAAKALPPLAPELFERQMSRTERLI